MGFVLYLTEINDKAVLSSINIYNQLLTNTVLQSNLPPEIASDHDFDHTFQGSLINKHKYNHCIFKNTGFFSSAGAYSQFDSCEFSDCHFNNCDF